MSEKMIVTLTATELAEIVSKAVANQLATLPQSVEVLRLEQAAEFLGRSPKTVMKLVETEGLPARYISDREPRFLRSALIEWLNNRPSKPAKKGNDDGGSSA